MTQPNAVEAYLTLDQILANPESHDQEWWFRKTECGTTACFAGITVARHGWVPNFGIDPDGEGDFEEIADHVRRDGASRVVPSLARDILGLNFTQSDSLFDSDASRDDLIALVEEIFGPRPEVMA